MDFRMLLQTFPLPLPATLTVATGFVAFIFFFSYWILHNNRRNVAGRLPPGPFPCPIIGNLHQLRKPVHRALQVLGQKYGPLMFLRLGSVPAVIVSSSAMAKHFLKTHDSIFASRPATAAGKYLSYNFKGVIMSSYGAHWRQMRKLCVSELLSAKRIESFKHVREEEVSEMIRSIWEESQNGTIAVNVSKATVTLTSNIIWRMLASRKFSDDELGADAFKGFRDLLSELAATAGEINIGDFIPSLDCFDLQGIKGRMLKVNKTYDAFAEKIIDDHLRMATNPSIDGHAEVERVKDFVDVLLQMTAGNDHIKGDAKARRETIKAIVLDMFAAGAETTANALEWIMSELLRHPHAMNRLQQEIDSTIGNHRKVNESDVGCMEYLQCVVKETLRLYPPVPLALPHESVEAANVGGFYIPKKTTVMVNVWAIGRDHNVWGADALEFKPERFMEEIGAHDNIMDLVSGQADVRMLPFSAGRRGCPGADMAIPTIELTLAQLLHSFDWKVKGDPSDVDMTEHSGASMSREVPLYAIPTLRGSF